jgi:excisionase family DNA binding protein
MQIDSNCSIAPIAVSVEEAGRIVSLSPHTIRAYIRTKRIRAAHVGRRVLVPVAELERLVSEGIEAGTSEKLRGIAQ